MSGLMYLVALGLVVYALFVVWHLPAYLTGGLLLIAVCVFGREFIRHTPVQAVEWSVLVTERHPGPTRILVLLLVIFTLGVTIWLVYGGK